MKLVIGTRAQILVNSAEAKDAQLLRLLVVADRRERLPTSADSGLEATERIADRLLSLLLDDDPVRMGQVLDNLVANAVK
ncbi:hypothetical protein ACH9D2_14915 [Kocuria sp. M4R2S49]